MSHSSKIFDSAPIQVQNRNGFDLSHLNVGSAKCGQLVPVLCKLLPPNSDFTLGVNLDVQLPPLAVPFFGRIDAIIEGFVVPCSILYGGWKQFISNQPATMFPAFQSTIASNASVPDATVLADEGVSAIAYGGRVNGYALPLLTIPSYPESEEYDIYEDGESNDSLLDYLGFRFDYNSGILENAFSITMLPFLAYHLIWDKFYRNKQITRTIFAVNEGVQSSSINNKNVSLIWHSFYRTGNSSFDASNSMSRFPDGVGVWHTRQRNYSRDYFTAAVPSPMQGTSAGIRFTIDAEDETGGFTIAALRSANALAKFLETNNLSQDYSELMRNRWGVRPIDADFEEPYYLGRVIVPVYQKSVYQQDNTSKSTAVNPFAQQGAIGTRGAAGGFTGEGSICKKFHNSTWAYVMCLFSLVPHAMYGFGINRELLMKNIGDFPAPEFQTVGYEEIWAAELMASPLELDNISSDSPTAFGYIPRYSRFKYMDDEVHGEMRPGRSLESFVLQRDFDNVPQLSSSFLEIPQSALDSVFAVSTSNMNLSCWYEIFFEFKVVMPLADFCIPTLGDLRDTHTIKTSIGGSKL